METDSKPARRSSSSSNDSPALVCLRAALVLGISILAGTSPW
jgi:hypothetical protein